jgi:hypothetical protein
VEYWRAMKYQECSACKNSVPATRSFSVNGDVLCEPCANKKVVELQKAKIKPVVVRGKDPTVCFKCSTDFGHDLPQIAGLPVCETCRQNILNFQYPSWLRIAALALFALLLISLVHGRSYFVAGHDYYKGKKLLDSGNAAGAVPYFEKALKIVPESQEVAANAALAYLRSGQPFQANKILEGRLFQDDDLYRTLKTEFDRWVLAAGKADQAGKLYSQAKYKEAAASMYEAAAAYPALPAFAMQAEEIDSAAAFSAGDYTTLLRLTQSVWRKYPSYESAAALASAYACIYASSGDETAKEKAVDMMAKAKTLAGSKEQQVDLQEWEPRFNHRLETRQILTKEQYDAAFRTQADTKEESR